jgi:sporulation protein YlmC with PRC-barrel domain
MDTFLNENNDEVGRRETVALIAASKVTGTSVYNPQGESLGSIYDVMLDKNSGKVSYAIMSFGGFLGIGEKYHPLPWHVMTYNDRFGGYVVSLDRNTLENAPSYGDSDVPDWSTRAYGDSIDQYYGGYPPVR